MPRLVGNVVSGGPTHDGERVDLPMEARTDLADFRARIDQRRGLGKRPGPLASALAARPTPPPPSPPPPPVAKRPSRPEPAPTVETIEPAAPQAAAVEPPGELAIAGDGERAGTPAQASPAGVRRRVTTEEVDAWAAAYARGESLLAIANSAGRSMSTVHRSLVRAGVQIRPSGHHNPAPAPGRPHSPQLAAKTARDDVAICQAYVDGASVPQIATRHGCAPSTIRRVLTSAGVDLRDDRGGGRHKGRGRLDLPPGTVRDLVDAYTAGASIDDLATEHGHHPKVIRRHLTDAGVTIRPPAHLAAAAQPTPPPAPPAPAPAAIAAPARALTALADALEAVVGALRELTALTPQETSR